MRHSNLLFLFLLLTACVAPPPEPPVTRFSTGGQTVYHLRPATVTRGGERAVIGAAYDGVVACYSASGVLLWGVQTGPGFPFDLTVADIDGDGLDESLVASSDGSLYALDDDGEPLWTFSRVPPLYQVAVARTAAGRVLILTGGVEQVLYALSPAGEVTGTLATEHAIRHIRTGDILGDGGQQAAVATAARGLSGDLSLLLVDPESLEVRWKKSNLGAFSHNSGKRFFSMVVFDRDGDGKDDIVLSDSWGDHGLLFGFDYRGEQVMEAADERIPNVAYRMNLLSHAKLASGDEFLLGLFGNILIVYNNDGSLREVLKSRYAFSNGAFDPETGAYYLGSSVSGGDGIYALHLDRPGWREAYETIEPVGKLARIEENLATLAQQVREFKPPSYQRPPREVTVIGKPPASAACEHVKFLSNLTLSEQYGDRSELWCRDIDRRRKYDLTAAEIIKRVKQREAEGADFVIWSGHGRAVYMRPQTMRRILEVAPRHFRGFVFAEMEQTDPLMTKVVERILLPLAEQCRRHGEKKILLLNKNVFWSGSAYLPFWKRVLLDEKYSNVFVPALEETNSRTQELSLMGRIGLWTTGKFRRWSCRTVTDNAVYDRMWEWSSQQVLSHHLRHLISRASLGADFFYNSIHQGEFSARLNQTLAPFYEMLDKGIVQIPEPDELLSVADVAIGMKSPPSPAYLRHGTNGHAYRYPADDHQPMVFDRLDCYWGGSPLPEHDFSKYAMGVDRRMLNFLPKMPYGLIAIVPDETPMGGASRFRRKISTDGEYWYDERGKRRGPGESKSTVEAELRASAARLPVLVKGDVSWSAVRIDESHIRVVLVDSGYVDPADRDAEIIVQQRNADRCTDILSGEDIGITNNLIRLHVPAGAIRVCDIAF